MSSIGVRIAIWYAAATTTALAGLFAAGYVLLENHLLHGLDLLNEAEFQQIAARLGPDYSTLSEPYIEMRIRETTDQAPALFYIDIDSPQHGVVFRSSNLKQHAIPSITGKERYSIHINDVGEARAGDFLMEPFTATIATPLQPVRDVMHNYVKICAGLLLSMLVLSLAIGRWLSSLLLTPIRLIRDTADSIRQDNLSKRIPVNQVHDEISDLARLLNQMFDRIEASFNQVRRFTSEASHELKTPLTLIRLNAEHMMRIEGAPPACAQAAKFQLEEVARLTRIIEDLMFLSRADAHAIALDLQPRDVGVFLDGFMQDATVLAEHHELHFDMHVVGVGNALFEPHWIRQVLLNLLVNAIHVSPAGGRITLESTLNDNSWNISVSDQGPGLDDSQCERMFERFVRFTKPGAEVNGNGLGMAICRSIITLHHGNIFARRSTSSSGLYVQIEIPVQAVTS